MVKPNWILVGDVSPPPGPSQVPAVPGRRHLEAQTDQVESYPGLWVKFACFFHSSADQDLNENMWEYPESFALRATYQPVQPLTNHFEIHIIADIIFQWLEELGDRAEEVEVVIRLDFNFNI